MRLYLLSPLIGIVVAYAILVFRLAIDGIHFLWLGADMENIIAQARAEDSYWRILAGPLIAGLLASLFLRFVFTNQRCPSVADILTRQSINDPRISPRTGFLAAIYSALCLGGGGSAGRESPAIHWGASLTILIGQWGKIPPQLSAALLACATGAAVTASFNAPIAGILFAYEIILRQWKLSSLLPIAIACVAASAITRAHFGIDPQFPSSRNGFDAKS